MTSPLPLLDQLCRARWRVEDLSELHCWIADFTERVRARETYVELFDAYADFSDLQIEARRLVLACRLAKHGDAS
jgi:hypothetical protein